MAARVLSRAFIGWPRWLWRLRPKPSFLERVAPYVAPAVRIDTGTRVGWIEVEVGERMPVRGGLHNGFRGTSIAWPVVVRRRG